MVSIVLVTYNRAHILEKSITDILNQSFRDFELIICDDCSPDDTEDICNHFVSVDSRIRYYRHSTNLRMPANLNFGIQKSRYELIAILHDGDRFRSDLIEQWVKALVSNPSAGFAFCSIATTDENNHIIQKFINYDEGLIEKEELLKNGFFRRPHFDSPVYGEAMVRKSLIENYGYFHEEFGFYADVDVWMELLHHYDAYYCSDILITGPLKSIEPNQFNTNLVKVFLYLFRMHSDHRKKSFGNDRWILTREMIRFELYLGFHLIYSLLLIVKNAPFRVLIDVQKRLREYPKFRLISISVLLAYPFLKLVLSLFDIVKVLVAKYRRKSKGD